MWWAGRIGGASATEGAALALAELTVIVGKHLVAEGLTLPHSKSYE